MDSPLIRYVITRSTNNPSLLMFVDTSGSAPSRGSTLDSLVSCVLQVSTDGTPLTPMTLWL